MSALLAQGTVVAVRDGDKNFNFTLDNGLKFGAFKTSNRMIPAQGQYVIVKYKQNGQYNNVEANGIQVSGAQAPQHQAPQAQYPQQQGGYQQQPAYNPPPQHQPQTTAQPARQYQRPAPQNDDRQLSIHYQSSRNAAIALVDAALKAGDIIALPAKKADKFDALLALVDRVSERYFLALEDVIKAGGITPTIPDPTGNADTDEEIPY